MKKNLFNKCVNFKIKSTDCLVRKLSAVSIQSKDIKSRRLKRQEKTVKFCIEGKTST